MVTPGPLDTEPHPQFRVYSAGNFGEVCPERISITTWSLVGDPMERGTRAVVRRAWPWATWQSGSHHAFVGYFSCRPYHNLSGYCQLAHRLPGVSPRHVTQSYFQDDEVPDDVVRGPRGRHIDLIAHARLLGDLWGLRARLGGLDDALTDLETAADFLGDRREPLLLGQVLSRARTLLDEIWEAHVVTTMGLVPLTAFQDGLGPRVDPEWSAIVPWLNRPRDLVWDRLHADFAAEPDGPAAFLAAPFYEVAQDAEPWRRYARTSSAVPDRQASRGGHRPAPGHVLRSLRGADPLLPPLMMITNLVGNTMESREYSKAMAMRCLGVFRRLLPALAQERDLDTDTWHYLRVEELLGTTPTGDLRKLASRRREQVAEALAQPAPEQLDLTGGSAPRAAARVRDGQPRSRGRGISPGIATGTVVTLEELATAPPDEPLVLVSDAVDANLQPLLGTLAGLVTVRGSALSHAAILMRERRLPAVVGHPVTSTLRSGQRIRLNGSTGDIDVLA